jgi:hypothetical protein
MRILTPTLLPMLLTLLINRAETAQQTTSTPTPHNKTKQSTDPLDLKRNRIGHQHCHNLDHRHKNQIPINLCTYTPNIYIPK